jgi:hypothetical protein
MAANAVVEHALAYPFDLPADSYALINGQSYAIVEFSLQPIGDTLLRAGRERIPLKRLFPAADAFAEQNFLPILASGSNAAPAQLRRKFARRLNSVIIPVVRVSASNVCSVYSAHFASYGSIPATLHWREGARTKLFCIFLPAHLLKTLHATESLDVNYGFYEVRAANIALPAARAPIFYAYISLWGNLAIGGNPVRPPAFPYEGPFLQAMTERQLFERLVPDISPGTDTPTFIHSVVSDATFRTRQTELLHRRFSSDNRNVHFNRVA